MATKISEMASQLARDAEAVCRHYLSNGRRQGGYWVVGDIHNTPGRSTFVRLTSSGGRLPGKWTDAATGEHGDLLDVIRQSVGLSFNETLDEARRFLALPRAERQTDNNLQMTATSGSQKAARRLFAASQPIAGTLVQKYLACRGIDRLAGASSLKFHPRCWHRSDEGPLQAWPAMIAAVTDLSGAIQGAHRTWLARDPATAHLTLGKAPFETPRRAMGRLLGNAVRFGRPQDLLLAGEGIETVLSLRCLLPALPAATGLSAGHLGAVLLPAGLRRLYVARENDSGSDKAFARLLERGHAMGVDVIGLTPKLKDFNDDLRLRGREAVHALLAAQLEPEDAARYLVVQ